MFILKDLCAMVGAIAIALALLIFLARFMCWLEWRADRKLEKEIQKEKRHA